MSYRYDDGGRSAYFSGREVGDCVVRAIAIAAELDYREAYDDLFERARRLSEQRASRGKAKGARLLHPKKTSPRGGVSDKVYQPYLIARGWVHVPLVKVGMKGPKPRYTNLPAQGRYIARMARHLVAVVDGVLLDTWDCRSRMVYGYWRNTR